MAGLLCGEHKAVILLGDEKNCLAGGAMSCEGLGPSKIGCMSCKSPASQLMVTASCFHIAHELGAASTCLKGWRGQSKENNL